MKSVMIILNQSIAEEVNDTLAELNIRGYTKFLNVHGQGTNNGEPHLGTHIWPSQNNVLLTVIDDKLVDPLLDRIKEIEKETEEQGLHAFVWNIEKMI